MRALSLPSESPSIEKSKSKLNSLPNRYKGRWVVSHLNMRALALCSLITTSLLIQGAPMTEAASKSVGVKKLLWSEEFKGKAGGSIDQKTWKYDLGDGSAGERG